MRLKLYISLILPLCVVSCMRPFDLKLDDTPVIYLESYPGIDEVVAFRVLPAYSYSNTASKPEFRPEIVFTVNGKQVPVVPNTGQKVDGDYPESYYIADYKVVPGDKLSVEVSSDGFHSISAETMIPAYFPESYPDRKIDYRREDFIDRKLNILYISVDKLPDMAYGYGVQLVEETTYFLPSEQRTDVTVYTGRQISDFYDMAPQSFDGKVIPFNGHLMSIWNASQTEVSPYKMSLVLNSYDFSEMQNSYESFFVTEGKDVMYDDYGNPMGEYEFRSRNKIILYTLSGEFYKFAMAQELKDSNSDFIPGLAPSNFCYSNIRDGYGVFAGITCTETDWITPEFIERNN